MIIVKSKAIYLCTEIWDKVKSKIKLNHLNFFTMTKADIVNEISKSTGIEKLTVQKAVEAFMDTVSGSLADGNNVYLRGFGSFIVKNVQKKQRATFPVTQLSLFLNTTFLLSSLPKHS